MPLFRTSVNRNGSYGNSIQASGRQDWMDVLRGIAIVLVIFGHAYGFAAEELGQENVYLHFFVEMVAPFRIPAMVFLSGLLVPASLAKGAREYLVGKCRAILYPYFLWSGIMLAVLVAAAILIGRAFDTGNFLRVFYNPIEHLWFLGYLFVYYLLALMLARIPAFISAAIFIIVSSIPGVAGGAKFWFLAGFFFLGVYAARQTSLWLSAIHRRSVALVCLSVGIGVFAVTASDRFVERYSALYSPFVLLAIIGASGLMLGVAHHRFFAIFRYIGVRSIIFYLVHWPIILVLNELLVRIVRVDVFGLVAIATMAAISISFLACFIVDRFAFASFFFRLPAQQKPLHGGFGRPAKASPSSQTAVAR